MIEFIKNIGTIVGAISGLFALRKWLKESWPGQVRYVSLPIATSRALDCIDGSLLDLAARRQALAPYGPQVYLANWFFLNDIPIEGRYLPSAIWRVLPQDALFANEFARDGAVLWDTHSHEDAYVDLRVSRRNLRIALRKLRLMYRMPR